MNSSGTCATCELKLVAVDEGCVRGARARSAVQATVARRRTEAENRLVFFIMIQGGGDNLIS
jgi:hypothetical protein